ncbi:TonB-dependent siderophore receptor [Steroidobacter sp.]|uniref:TonB-dependent siderophore receptor n=1 Tax=Steroidobacter sp. TaxID=1978227 RepID=UPI001A59B079|nr:TonB-dependent siderophore receptor [Steroidobacter sp.]MBL8267505.1 TonB-dependent siderophore receptor [Steroidobacter sp.]
MIRLNAGFSARSGAVCRWLGALAMTGGCLVQPVLAAQDAALEEVIVTAERKFRPEVSTAASKFELPIIETPQALTVLSSEFLDIARLNDTASVVAYTPGVELGGIGDGTQAAISARGFPINRERGFRINGLSTDSELDLDYFAMDRVEIVRGPASALYGEADYGATFNRVLKRPSNTFAALTAVEVGSYDFRRVQADVQGPLGGSGIFSGRATAAVQDSETFIDHTEDDRILFAPSLNIALDRTNILLQGYYQKLEGSSSDGFALLPDGNGGYVLPDLPRRRNYGSTANEIDSENKFFYAQLDHELSDSLKLAVKAGYSRVEMHNASSFLLGSDAAGNQSLLGYPEYKTKEDLSVDASIEKTFELGGRDQRFLVSADWRRNELFNPWYGVFSLGTINIFQGGPQPVPGGIPPAGSVDGEYRSSKQDFSGVTVLTHLKPTDRLSLLLGARYSSVKTGIHDYVPTASGYIRNIDGLDDDGWVPRVAAVYEVANGHNVYASYSKGIVFNQTFLRANGSPINPESGVQYELGVKGEILDRRVMYAVSLYRITRTDVAAGIFVPGQPDVYYNVGKQVHEGGEFEIIGEVIPGLNLVASYSNLGIDIRESANPAEVGHRPYAAPRHSYSLFATYEFLEGPLRSLTLGGGVVGRSEREVDSVGSFQLPSYTRVDFRASYRLNEAMLLEFNLQNAFNEDIYTSVYQSPNLGIAYAYPRTMFGKLSYRW